MIDRMRTFKPVLGDDNPFYTMVLNDCPSGFHFENLTPDTSLIKTTAIWNKLIEYCELFYKQYEIVGKTLKDWLDGLQISYESNKYRFEKILDSLDSVTFDKGQVITRSKTIIRDRDFSQSGTDNNVNESIELAFSSANNDPSSKVTDTGTNSATGTEDITDTETETVNTDRFMGEDSTAYFNWINDNFPNVLVIFANYFKDNFTLGEVLIW